MRIIQILAPLMLMLAACGGPIDEGEEATAEDEVSSGYAPYYLPNGCSRIHHVDAAVTSQQYSQIIYRVKAHGVGANARVRFDRCTFGGTSPARCEQIPDSYDWHLVSRVDATQGTNGNWSAQVTTGIDRGPIYVYYRAKEAKGTSDGAECPYSYSPPYRMQ